MFALGCTFQQPRGIEKKKQTNQTKPKQTQNRKLLGFWECEFISIMELFIPPSLKVMMMMMMMMMMMI